MVRVTRARTEGFDAVEQLWRRFVPSARLESPDTAEQAALDWISVESDGLSVVGYELTAGVHSAIRPEGQLMACRVAARDGWVRAEGRPMDVSLPWVCADRSTAEAGWQGRAVVRALVFDLQHAQEVARQIAGDDDLILRVRDPAPRSRVHGAHWERVYQYVFSSFAPLSGIDVDPLIVSELGRHALHTTLMTFRTTFLESLEKTAQTRPAPATVRRAMTYMDSHAREPITIDDVAAAVGISTRGLQAAFHRATGTTPSVYLRAVRLSGVHEELLAGAPGTVAEIARRWGFHHPSRFASFYRGRYGVSPHETASTR
jgi:AraC-like DNA-binding protein